MFILLFQADEMAALIQNQTSSDEKLETSMRLLESTKLLEHLREENSCLKSALQQFKENSLNVSKAPEQSQSYFS